VLGSRTEFLRIEGHTDNVPIHNKHFDSNKELSSGRATELIKLCGAISLLSHTTFRRGLRGVSSGRIE